MSSFKDCDACARVSDNKNFNCPPKMADGRHYTDYRPRCLINYLSPNDQPLNSYEYRQFLINNAEKIMYQNMNNAYKLNACGPCEDPYNVGTMLPEQNMVSCDASTCKMFQNDQNGLGVGRQYQPVDVKSVFQQKFLADKELEQKYFKNTLNCCSTPVDDLNYFPLDMNAENGQGSRFAMPSGGVAMSGGDRLAV